MAVRLSDHLKEKYGEKVYRLSLSSGCGCPNRDGSIGITGGCTFCSEGGSGEFAAPFGDVDKQIDEAKKRISQKTDAKKFIAYFQSYTNTYGDPERLGRLYKKAIERDDIVALSLGTRPDCLGQDIMDMLKELNAIKPVCIELGLQTVNDGTAKKIRRGYELEVFEKAYDALKKAGLTVVVHVIFGLPGESEEDMLRTIRYLSDLTPSLDGIKIQNLQILKGTDLYMEYEEQINGGGAEGDIKIMSMDEYTDLVAKALAILPEKTVVHRMTGDGPRKILAAPLWSLDKKRVINMLNRKTRALFI